MKKLLLAAVAAAAMTGTANATVITFDDLPGGGTSISSGYNSLNWNNLGSLQGSSLPTSGYNAGTVSLGNVAYNLFGNPASITSGVDFALNSFYLTAAWFNDLNVTVSGYNNGSLVFSQILAPSATAPTLYSFGGALIDQLDFVSTAGSTVELGYSGSGRHFALDNFTINARNAVPEPATWALLIAGFGMVGGAMRRRQTISVTYA